MQFAIQQKAGERELMGPATAKVMDLDQRDVEGARQGRQDAAERLYRRHHHRVWNMARLMTGSVQDAEDICQDAFIRALGGLDRFRGDARFSTWLYRITVNLARNLYARRQRRAAAADDLPDPRGALSPEGSSSAELRAALTQALARLTEGQREVFTCHEVFGMSHQEIAYVLGCAEGTSKAQLHKARLRLRQLLKGGKR